MKNTHARFRKKNRKPEHLRILTEFSEEILQKNRMSNLEHSAIWIRYLL